MPNPNPWLTTEQLCAELAISRSTETAGAYVLLYHDSGSALYATSATEAEIYRANTSRPAPPDRIRLAPMRRDRIGLAFPLCCSVNDTGETSLHPLIRDEILGRWWGCEQDWACNALPMRCA
jgi:hypothetical protein